MEIQIGDVLHRLIHNAPWSEGDRLDAIAAVTKEFGHPTPRPTLSQVADTMQKENESLKAQVAESEKRLAALEDAMIKAGLAQARPAAPAATSLGSLAELQRLRAENDALRAGQDATVQTASEQAAAIKAEQEANA